VVEISQVEIFASRAESDAINVAKLGGVCRTAIAAETFPACAGEWENHSGLCIDSSHAVIPGVGNEQIVSRTDRSEERRVGDWSSDVCSSDLVVEISQVEIFASRAESDAINVAKLGGVCRTAIAAETFPACAGEWENHSGLCIDSSHAVIPGVGNEQIVSRTD